MDGSKGSGNLVDALLVMFCIHSTAEHMILRLLNCFGFLCVAKRAGSI